MPQKLGMDSPDRREGPPGSRKRPNHFDDRQLLKLIAYEIFLSTRKAFN
jgi:hypothetical protein